MNLFYCFLLICLFIGYSSKAQNIFPANGYVGIGTSSPGAKLDVAGNNGNFVGSDVNIARSNSNSGVGQSPNVQFADRATGFSSIIQSYQGHLQFFNNIGNGWTECLRITGQGYLGVGTPNPDAKLSVQGTIHTQEVKVDMNGWSDYVFKHAYRLKPLAEVKAYIDKNRHLPDVPSEQEVLKEGVNLGEMNKVLLKKVEELTLYMIAQQNQVKSQIEREKRLEKKIEIQQARIGHLQKQMTLVTHRPNQPKY